MAAVAHQGYFSLLRWRADPTRDEARNVALLIVVPEAQLGLVRAAPLNSVSPRLHDQGIVDELLAGLEHQFAEAKDPNVDLLTDLHTKFQRSLLVTEPRPVAIDDFDADVTALYRAYLAQRSGGARAPTKGAIRDRVTGTLRDRGFSAVRGQYVEDVLFDIVIQNGDPRPTVVEVLSFAGERKDWTPVEHDAGHFLYGCQRVDVAARAVILPPADDGRAIATYDRISQWFQDAAIPSTTLDEFLETPQEALELEEHASA
jgi:hypothetical protein